MNSTRDQLYKNYLKTRERLTIYEVAICIDRSPQTISNWYRWKKLNPTNKLAKRLPDYMQNGERQTRYWRGKDVKKLIKFRDAIPLGAGGIMSEVTQKYIKKENKGE